jgi:hypothetical protein
MMKILIEKHQTIVALLIVNRSIVKQFKLQFCDYDHHYFLPKIKF